MAMRCIPRFVLSLLCVGLLVALSSSPVAASVMRPAEALETTANTPFAYPPAAVDVSGTISSNTTWTLANSPYRVTGNVTVAAGVTLTIEPGVVVQFNQFRGLWVDGTLNAVGTAANPITFTGTTETLDWWNSIHIQNAGSGTFAYVTIAYAGYWESGGNAGLSKTGTGALDIQHSTIHATHGEGLRIAAGSSRFTSANNRFTNNTTGVVVGVNASFDDNTSTFADNGMDVYLEGGTITQPVTWNLNPAYSFYVSNNVTVGEAGELTILPGTVVKLAQYRMLWVDGMLRAEGTAEAPIYFTSWRDDTVGGDANNDGTATSPASDWWNHIEVRHAGSASLTYVTLAYAGWWEYGGDAGLVKSGTGDLTLQHSTIRQTSGDGLRVAGNTGLVALTDTLLVSNTTGMRLATAGQVSGQGNRFQDNSAYGLLQDVNDSFGYTGNAFAGNGTAAVGINGGTRLTDMLLSPAGNPFRIIGNTTITATTTLTVESGVQVEFTQFRGLWVNGTIHAVGTSTLPITFTGTTETPDWWNSIHIQNAGSGTFAYVTIANAGYWEYGGNAGLSKTGTGALDIQHSTIHATHGEGLRIAAGSSRFTSANNRFTNNTTGVVVGVNASFDDNTSTFADNGMDVYLEGGTITQPVTWNLNPAYSFYVSNNVTVGEAGELTILPGTVVKFAQYRILWVDGMLRAEGTAAAPIFFTDWRDDTVGGDANNDGTASSPTSDWWNHIEVRNAGNASLAYVTLAYAGWWEYGGDAGLVKSGTGDLTLQHSTIRQTSGDGLRVAGNTGLVALTDTLLVSNTTGMRLATAGQVSGQGNRFQDNSAYGLLQDVNDSFGYTGNAFAGNGTAAVGINGGTRLTDMLLSPAGNPFRIIGNTTITATTTLTVESGVQVEFTQFRGLWVNGTIHAVGTSTLPITFTGTTETPDWWNSIHIQNAGSGTFAYVTIANAGYWEYGGNAGLSKTGTGALDIQHSTIHAIHGEGLRIAAGSSSFTSANNRFTNNTTGVVVGLNASFDDNTSTFADNGMDVYLEGGTITQPVTWNLNPAYSFYVSNNVTVGEAGELTILPGTVVKLAQYRMLWVDGMLRAEGTAAAPIFFTSWRDDTVGGDANNDGTATSPASDWWNHIEVRHAGSASLTYVTLAYAGWWEYGGDAGLVKSGTGDLTLQHSTIRQTSGDGLRLNGSTGAHTLVRNQLTNNATGILVQNQAEALVVSHHLIEGNTNFGVRNVSSANVDARSTWWGDATGPRHASNPEGLGDTVSDGVLFTPWRTTPSSGQILAPRRDGTLVAGDWLRFSGSTVDDAQATYRWTFGDGRSFATRTPGLIAFPNPGVITVTYTATSDGGDDPYPDQQTFTVVPDTGNLPDLVLTQVTVPITLAVGQPASLSYRVQNTGQGAAGPTWQDAVYLSTDAQLDRTDQLLGAVASNRTLAPGASYEQTILVTLPTLEEGSYNLIVVVNDTWQVLELRRLNNEQATLITAQVPVLQAGVDQVSSYTTGRVEHFYRLNATGDGQHLVLDASRVPTTLEVSLRFGALPTRGTYDERISGGERLVVPAATAGQWYLLIAGNATTDGTYTIQYDLTALALTGSAPARQGTQADLELALTGAGFLSPLEIALVGPTGTVYEAQAVDVDSSTAARATFPAGTVPAGVYGVRVTHHAQTATLPTAVTLIEGGTAKLDLDLILPARFGYHQLATVFVEYTNSGDAPMPAPLLLVTATQNGQPGAIITLEQHRLSDGFWTSAMPQGFANDVQFLAAGETPGVLQPGETRRVPVYYAGWQRPWDFSYPPFDWEVKVLDATDTTPVDWAALKDGMRPDYMQPDAWEVVWANYTALAGNTWGDYVRMLSQNAQYLARLGQRVDDITTLQAFSFRQADGLSPIRVLANGIDGSVQAPGVGISFERSYHQPISRRFELGDLGRGWTHNWNQQITVSTDGTVSIIDLTGTPRIFQPDSRYSGRYLAQPGDQGILRAADGGHLLTETSGLVQFYREGKLQYVEDPNGNRITCAYTDVHLTRLSHSAGGALDLSYNAAGYLTSITDQDGRQTSYSYTGEQLTSVTAFDGQVTTYSYGNTGAANHALTSVGQPDGVTYTFTYDAQGRLASTYRDAEQERLSFAYANGRVSMTDALGHTSRSFFDAWGRAAKIENALGEAVVLHFNTIGRLVSVTDPTGLSTTFGYDIRGNLTEATDALRRTTRFVYERSQNLLGAVTDPAGNRTAYSYDERGNLNAITYPDTSREQWSYDARGNPTTWTNRRGNAISYAYDTAGRTTSKTYADASVVTYRYDARGNLIEAVDASGTTTLSYNEHDVLTRINFPHDRWLSFSYDAAGRRTTSTDQLGYELTYTYEAGRLSQVADAEDDLVRYTYDASGRLATQTLGNGVVTTYSYDAAGRLLSLVNAKPDESELSRFVYTYDRRGRRIEMETHYGMWRYTYDDAGQLLQATLTSSDPAIADQDLRYTYDTLGNRVRTTVNGVETSYDANALNQYTSVGEHTYTYDLDGNLIRDEGPGGVTVYTYSDDNRLIGVTRGGDTWTYTYDALGNRVAVDENGAVTHYVVDPLGLGNAVATYAADGELQARYSYGNSLLQRWTASEGTSFYSFDPLGNASELTNASTVVQNDYAYRPFGETILRTATIANPFEFMGAFGVLADPTGLHHMRARQYDAAQGRFYSLDPLGFASGDLNGYRYAMGNPVSFIDPDGEFPFALLIWSYATYRTSCGVVDVYHAGQDQLRQRREAELIDDPWDDRARLTSKDSLHSGMRNAETVIEFVAGETVGTTIGSAAGTTVETVVDVAWSATDRQKTWGETFFPCSFSRDPIPPPNPPAGSGTSGAGGSAGSQDPNEKISVAGFGTGNFVRADTLVTYRIDFENYPDATAPAQVVTIRDPLSTDLDWSTLELTEIGFGEVMLQVPPGRQEFQTVVDYTYTDDEYDFTLEVHVEAWLEDGQLNVNFTSIDPVTNLPPTVDKGFLPPETDPATGRGRGFVAYTIRPQPGLPSGTAIRNIATIQFDFSLEIDTNQVDPMDKSQGTDPTKEALVTFDRLAPTSSVTALPAVTPTTPFTVTWQGADDANGSGVASYEVYVQESGGAWTTWLTNTTATAAAFDGQNGQTYSFYVVATDNVGHRENKPAQAEATTTVTVQSRYMVYLPLTVR
ncbi:hypothetical protein EYB53_003010 [Candidatus Chloroploca sp. M-50]|uniref:PKD domain-containing protein n=1 Tax=Candidatus Chloroploca mongolica TaxID=2528176 RepID=A0ABS4D5F6_9CHLR|nr:RHS repeat-associated core domain-containing protein [Candidatus Chloroploca mongolica]MBP1464672.1 hypothetical protein [Candidatus Chloroploca mongolica]